MHTTHLCSNFPLLEDTNMVFYFHVVQIVNLIFYSRDVLISFVRIVTFDFAF